MCSWDGISWTVKGKVFNRSLFVGGACHMLSAPWAEPVCGWFVSLTESVVGLLTAMFGSSDQCSDTPTVQVCRKLLDCLFLDVLTCGLEGENNSIRSCKKTLQNKTFHNRFFKTYLHLHHNHIRNTAAAARQIRQMIIMLVTPATFAECWWKKERKKNTFF